MIDKFVHNRILSIGIRRNPKLFSHVLEGITVIVTYIHSTGVIRGGEPASLETHYWCTVSR